MLLWFGDFLDQRLIHIRYGNAHSRYRTLHTGLPQGTVTSCLLFDVYVDGLICSLIDENIYVLMYNDGYLCTILMYGRYLCTMYGRSSHMVN